MVLCFSSFWNCSWMWLLELKILWGAEMSSIKHCFMPGNIHQKWFWNSKHFQRNCWSICFNTVSRIWWQITTNMGWRMLWQMQGEVIRLIIWTWSLDSSIHKQGSKLLKSCLGLHWATSVAMRKLLGGFFDVFNIDCNVKMNRFNMCALWNKASVL